MASNLAADEIRAVESRIPASWAMESTKSDTIVVDAGRYELTETAMIPDGTTLVLRPGVTVAMGPGVSILSGGLVLAMGTAEQPVVFTWLEPDSVWGVIGLYESGADGSIFRHCIVEHGSERPGAFVAFSGTLSAYSADITISECTFTDNEGEDGINVKNAHALVENCLLIRQNDAIDFDDPEDAVVTGCEIRDSVNDGIDLGGPELIGFTTVRGNRITGSGDKGISLGAGVAAQVENNIIEACSTGVAIKDGADPTLVNNTLVNNVVGLHAYEKVLGRGGGRGSVTNTIIWGNALANVLVEDDSSTEFTYSGIGGGWPGIGNIDVDPAFTTYRGFEWLLSPGSPCIDAGDPTLQDGMEWPDWYPNETDSDMGAYGGPFGQGWFGANVPDHPHCH